MLKVIWVLSLSLLTACVLSIEPVIPESAGIADDRLLGTWKEVDGGDQVVISRTNSTAYSLTYTDSKGKVGWFDARLGRLGRHLLLDVRPAESNSARDVPEAGAMIRGHLLVAIDVAGDSARVALLQPDSLRGAIARESVRLSHRIGDDQLILTGTTDELRLGLTTYLDQGGSLDAPGTWLRIAGPSAQAPLPGAAVREPAVCFEAAPWREADQLFHRDPHWLGSDVASSVDLGGGRVLWLFGDTWIDPTGLGARRGARMVSNTVAIQHGSNPVTASIKFYWGKGADGAPRAFFPDRGEERLWLGNGVRVDDRLVIFLSRIRHINSGLGFESAGWTAVMIENPDDEPAVWHVTPIVTPPNPLGVAVGFAAVRRLGEYVYAFGSEDPVKSHPLYAARWSVAAVRRGDLQRPEWWTGSRFGWVPDSSSVPRWPLFENGSSELSLHFDALTQQYLVIQAAGFGPADIVIRNSPQLTGPWTSPRMVYRPGEYSRPNVMIYAAKAHPELAGADLVVTYATNSFQFADAVADSMIYYPRFVRFMRCP